MLPSLCGHPRWRDRHRRLHWRGAPQHRRRDDQAEGRGALEINDERSPTRILERQITGLFAVQGRHLPDTGRILRSLLGGASPDPGAAVSSFAGSSRTSSGPRTSWQLDSCRSDSRSISGPRQECPPTQPPRAHKSRQQQQASNQLAGWGISVAVKKNGSIRPVVLIPSALTSPSPALS